MLPPRPGNWQRVKRVLFVASSGRLSYEIETLSSVRPRHVRLSHLLSLISWVLFLCPGIVLTLATLSARPGQGRPRRRQAKPDNEPKKNLVWQLIWFWLRLEIIYQHEIW